MILPAYSYIYILPYSLYRFLALFLSLDPLYYNVIEA
jgi:hypothetical protein